MKLNKIPRSLRTWFTIHFVVDLVFAIPLLLFPTQVLQFFGWTTTDPLTTRLVAAALIGIGVESFLGRNGSIDSYHTMLRLKLLWSASASIAIAISIFQGAPQMAWAFQVIFMSFFFVWAYYKRRLGQN